MSRPRVVFVCMLLALVTLLVYLPVRPYAFVGYDDPVYVTENPIVQAGLTWAGVKYAFTTWHASNWHPLTWLSHMLDCQLFGLNAGSHHLVSVLFHATNAVLLLLLLLRMTGAFWQSAFIAALFAWHPLHVESVAWVAERKDVLSAFFGLLTLLAYVRYAQRRSRGEGRRSRADIAVQALDYLLALFFFACGLMSKPMLVTLPFVFLLLDYWPLQRVPDFELRISHWSRLVWEKWPFFVLAAASCVVTFVAQQRGEAVTPLKGYPLSSRIANAAVSYVKYLFNSVYPAHLAVIYPLPRAIPLVQVAGAIMVLAVITGLVWRLRVSRPYLLMGWLWYLGMLVPVIGLVQVGSQAMADRYTYLPLIGVFIGVVFGLGDLAKKLRFEPMVMISVAGIVLAGCLFATARQLQYWRDGETLFEHTLAVTKDNPIAQISLGAALLQTGQPREAMEHFREALRLKPDDVLAHYNLGNTLAQTGQPQEAIKYYQEALRLKPDYATAHNNLGGALLQTGHLQEAITHFKRALQLEPNYPKAHNGLGLALFQNGQVDEAIAQFRTALQLQPDFTAARNHLDDALKYLAWTLATCPDASVRNGVKAVGLAQQAEQLSGGKDPEIITILAAAYAEAGRFPEAITTAQRALDLATAQTNTAVADALRTQIKCYQAGSPFRDSSLTNISVKLSGLR